GGARPSAAGRTWAAAGAGLFAGAAGAATAGGRRADCGGGSVGGLGGCMGRAAPIVGGGCGLDPGGSDARAHGPARGGAGLGDAGLHRGLGVLDAGAVCAGSGTGGGQMGFARADGGASSNGSGTPAGGSRNGTGNRVGAWCGAAGAQLRGVDGGKSRVPGGRAHAFLGGAAERPLPRARCCVLPCGVGGGCGVHESTGRAVAGLAWVTAASATGTVPMDPSNGPPMPHGPENLIQVFPMMVTPGYFDVMGARLMEGRDR